MALILFDQDDSKTIKMGIATLSNSGNQFSAPCKPSQVIKYTPTAPAGITLTENTSTPQSPGTGEWGYYNGTVYLGDSLQEGETAVAVKGDRYIFENKLTLGNTLYFDLSSSDENKRTKVQKLSLIWLTPGEELQNVTISTNDFVSGAGSSTAHYYLAYDENGQPGEWQTTLTFNVIQWLERVYIWVKCVKPEGGEAGTFADVHLHISATRYRYTRQYIEVTSATQDIPTNLDHPYFTLLYRRVGTSTANFPTCLWISDAGYIRFPQGSYYFIIQPLDRAVTSGFVSTMEFTASSAMYALPTNVAFESLVLYTGTTYRIDHFTDEHFVRARFDTSNASGLLFTVPTSALGFLTDGLASALQSWGLTIAYIPMNTSISTTVPAYSLFAWTVVSVQSPTTNYSIQSPYCASLTSTTLTLGTSVQKTSSDWLFWGCISP